MTRAASILLLSVAMLAGCTSEPTGAEWAKSHAVLSDRLEAAKKIGDSGQRDEAMLRLATDATKKRDGGVALEAVAAISSTSKRDPKAKECAIAFHDKDDRAVARKFVDLVGSSKTRDELNAYFAK